MSQKTRDIIRQVLTFASVLAGIAYVNLSQVRTLHDAQVGEIARSVPTFFFPANYAFSIWGVIHIALIAYAIYQLLPTQRQRPLLRQIALYASFNVLLSALWVFVYSERQLWLSLLVMLAQLGLLIECELVLRRHEPLTRGPRWLVDVPLSLSFGWISVATIANGAQVLVYELGWTGRPLTGEAWAVVMLIVAGLLSAFMVLKRGNLAFAVAATWGIFAEGVRYWRTASIASTAVVVSIVILAMVATVAFKPSRIRSYS